ncbi:MAG: Energy-coupling factor transporter ATP-binding protein EcfA2 [Smithella sp. PtaU1.Bin162]|nr:MAG: Energy-coupling factor transporter ATP-binding protein EcfA2 [Smithella sp. PtaU1.Bin162]
MIKINNIFYQYEGSAAPALSDISMEIHEGEYVALTGSNGCGKTTLIRQLNALVRPDRGTVTIDGLDTADPANHKEIRRLVGMLFQNPDNQIVGMTVEEDIAFGPGNLNLPPQEIRRQVHDILESFGLQSLAGRAPHTLSGGEKRLVSLAGVLIMNPRYIAFDEPTAYLDATGRRRVLAMMKQLHKKGIGIIHITHDAADMADADRLLIMNRGKLIRDGHLRDILCAKQENTGFTLPLPPITELIRHLNRQGWSLTPDIFTVEEAGREIHRLLTRAR